MRVSGDLLSTAISHRVQLWPGSLWNPTWYSRFEHAGCGELLSLYHPDIITEACRFLLKAGADAISTNTLGATANTMRSQGVDHDDLAQLAFEANFESARLACVVSGEYSTPSRHPCVIGSVGPTIHSLSVMGGGPDKFAELERDYLLQIRALWQGGVDLLHFERFLDLQNLRAALVALEQYQGEIGTKIPIILTAQMEAIGTMLDGSSFAQFAAFADQFRPLAMGVIGRNVDQLVADAVPPLTPIVALPDAFAPCCEDAWFETPASLAERISHLVSDKRIRIVGVGLGARPDYVREIRTRLAMIEKCPTPRVLAAANF